VSDETPTTAEEIEERLAELDDLVIEPPKDDYPFVEEGDQKLRCFLVDGFIQPDYEGKVMLETLDMLYKWVKTGDKPTEKPVIEPAKSRLRAVPNHPKE
jgi:hypothetical protein